MTISSAQNKTQSWLVLSKFQMVWTTVYCLNQLLTESSQISKSLSSYSSSGHVYALCSFLAALKLYSHFAILKLLKFSWRYLTIYYGPDSRNTNNMNNSSRVLKRTAPIFCKQRFRETNSDVYSWKQLIISGL